MRFLLTCPQGQVSGEKGRRHLLTRPWGRISATPHKTWVFPLTCPSSFLRPWGNFWLALSVTAAPCQLSRRESQVGSPPEACRKPGLASPFGGAGAVRRLRGQDAAVRERRFAVSLAFFPALRAHKGKAVGRWSHLPVRSAQGVCHRQTAPHTLQAF